MVKTEKLYDWLKECAAEVNADPDGFHLGVANDDSIRGLASDLTDIGESACAIHDAISNLIKENASSDTLQTALFDIESHVAHIRWHWQSATGSLRANDLWPEDDLELHHED